MISALLLLVTACGGSAEIPLEQYEITEAGIVIEHPVGWQTATDGRATVLAETQDGFLAAFEADPPLAHDLTIIFDHREIEFMRSIGFDAEPATPAGLFEFNLDNFGWEALGEMRNIEILGSDAVVVRVATQIGVSEVIQGFLPGGEEIFLLELSGPDEQVLDDFLPIWEAIIADIAPIG